MKYANNPFNIRYSALNNWKGQIGQSNGFCLFSDLSFGVRACAYLLMRTYRKYNLVTYSQVIERFAPPSENDTQNYVNNVCNALHVFPFDVLRTQGNYVGLMRIMAQIESGTKLSPDYILNVMKRFKLSPYECK